MNRRDPQSRNKLSRKRGSIAAFGPLFSATMPYRRTYRPSFSVALPCLVALLGCGSESSSDPTTTSTSTSVGADLCKDMAETCFAKQSICVASGESASCETCPSAEYATKEGTCEKIPGTAYTHQFAEFEVKSGEEIKGLCQSWTLNNPEELWINTVELTQSASSHHSNWTYVPDTEFEGPDGVWPCKDRNYSQLQAAVTGGVVYAQSTQAEHEVQKFPNGAAVRIPPFARIIGDVHLLNTTDKDAKGSTTFTIYSLKKDEVTVKLAPFHLVYEGLNIPPQSDSRFTGQCDNLDTKFGANGFKMNIYFILPHYHALGKSLFVDIIGGKNDGERIFEIGAFDGEAHGRNYDPPYAITDAKGLAYGCDFTNPRDEYITYGLGDQEMCELLGFAESDYAFESASHEANSAGKDGATQLFTSPCDTLAFKWAQDKPGGNGP